MKRLSVFAMSLAFVAAASVAVAQDRPVTTTRLSDKLYLLSVDEDNYSTNSLAFVGSDGVLLVDTQDAQDAPALRAAVDALGGGPVRYIINTHRHTEHIGGNTAFGTDPVIIAHALVPARLRRGAYLFAEIPDAALPDITVADSLTLFFNGEPVRIVALPGSHDDNEIIVHFTASKLVHLSSLVNGFNFPSVDSDGDALRFPELVERAMALLPHDVRIISGHSPRGEHRAGTWADLRPYHDMMVRTIEIVRGGLAQGRDVAAMQRDSVLREYGSYARSYVGENGWINTLATRLQRRPGAPIPAPLFTALHETYRSQGAAAAVARYSQLRRDHPTEYAFGPNIMLIVAMTLSSHEHFQDAVTFLEGQVREYPDAPVASAAYFYLAQAQQRLGNLDAARRACQRSLELNPGFAPATALLAELNRR